MRDVYLVEAARTAVARGGKQSWFMNARVDELSAIVMKELRARIGIGEDQDKQYEFIDDVIWATCANAYMEQGGNMGRCSWILSGGNQKIAGCTVDRLCASSLTAIQFGISTMMTGWGGDVVFAGGGQHMTHIPMGAGSSLHPDFGLHTNPMSFSMGWTAEQVARRYNVSREDQDVFACEAHRKCAAAQDANGGLGKTKDAIIPIKVKVPKKGARIEDIAPAAKYTISEHLANDRVEDGITDDVEMTVFRDQGLRRETNLEGLAKLAPVFMQDELATVTAGNSSQINDAAAGVVLATEAGIKKLGLKPVMKLKSYAVEGCDPEVMGIGPSVAIPKVLKRSGMSIDQIGLWEVNEAFASQCLYCARVLNLPQDRLNLWGSGIAIGHPLACTGARIACDISYMFRDDDFKDVDYIVESMCIGGGQGAAAIWERVK